MSEKQQTSAPAVDPRASTSGRGKAKVLVAVSVLCALLWTISSPRLCSMMSPSAENVTADKLLEESPLIGKGYFILCLFFGILPSEVFTV